MKYISKDPSRLCALSVNYKKGNLVSYFALSMKDNGVEILKRNHLSVTNIRKDILRLLQQKNTGLSHRDFEKGLSINVEQERPYTEHCRLSLKKGSSIPYPQWMIPFNMRFAKTTVPKISILTITLIFHAKNAGRLIALIRSSFRQ